MSRAYGRGLLLGIAQYARVHGPWTLFAEERGLVDRVPDWFEAWDGDGILARVESSELEEALYRKSLPVIDLRGTRSVRMPVIDTDNRLIAHLAAERFLADGYRNLAFCGFGGLNYSEIRRDAFVEDLRARGHDCHVYETCERAGADIRDIEQIGLFIEPELSRWLSELPKPVGIFACNDIRGQQLINLCREIDIPVPERIAIIGVDNDETLCELSDPTLSSIDLDTHAIGYRAAQLLDSMMHGARVENDRILVAPDRLVSRQSTAVPAVEDENVARALWFIRVHATENISVDEVADSVNVSRRVLERRFREILDRTPHEEIRRVRIERAKRLLIETNLSQPVISEKCGFSHPEYLTVVFKREVGETPSEYRARNSLL